MQRPVAYNAFALVWKMLPKTTSDFKLLKKATTPALSKAFPFSNIEIRTSCYFIVH
ncbi:hypothetical protein ILT44_27305 [Microvirga sp. BT689]|uniref:hypothetical protein n=1 Tax=Microvirga arvi TaxID=2778731 RepID=UPI00194E92A6|nr:hypothetical protein [Microvirga arvi]MBM6583914.1 hypothetical protein [Microvirga arvi]